MAYRLTLDENVEHEVLHRLENYGHDVEHLDFASELGKGTDDQPIARYSQETDRIIVTYDVDFALELDDDDYRAAFYFADATLSAKQVADVIHRVSKVYAQEEVVGFEYVGTEWLSEPVDFRPRPNLRLRRVGAEVRLTADTSPLSAQNNPLGRRVESVLRSRCTPLEGTSRTAGHSDTRPTTS